MVERTLPWLARFRRLTVRSERRDDLNWAVLTLGCALICRNTLQRLDQVLSGVFTPNRRAPIFVLPDFHSRSTE